MCQRLSMADTPPGRPPVTYESPMNLAAKPRFQARVAGLEPATFGSVDRVIHGPTAFSGPSRPICCSRVVVKRGRVVARTYTSPTHLGRSSGAADDERKCVVGESLPADGALPRPRLPQTRPERAARRRLAQMVRPNVFATDAVSASFAGTPAVTPDGVRRGRFNPNREVTT